MNRIVLFLFLIQAPLCLVAQQTDLQAETFEQIQRMPDNEQKVIAITRFFNGVAIISSDNARLLTEKGRMISGRLNRADLLANLLLARSHSELRMGNLAVALINLNEAEAVLPVLNDTLKTNVQSELALLYSRAGNKTKARGFLRELSSKSRGGSEFHESKIHSILKQTEAYAILNDKNGVKTTVKEAVSLASATGDRKLLIGTKLALADKLTDLNENSLSRDLLNDISDESSSKEENIHILSLLIINSIKLDRTEEIDDYYRQLGQLVLQQKDIRKPEYWLAIGMYLDLKKQYLRAGAAYRKLAGEFNLGRVEDMYMEGTIRLGSLYSKELKRDSADHFFNLVSARLKGPAKYQATGILYLQALREHHQRFKQGDSLIAAMSKAISEKDSLYRLELVNATRELEYRYKIMEGKQQLKLVSQQQKLDAMTYTRNKQRSLLIILGLSLLVVIGGALSYIFNQRRKQASLLHKAELERLEQIHRTEVVKALANAEEAERRRIADQLHDEVGSMLSVARLNLSSLRSTGDSHENISPEQLNTANRILGTVAGTIREMSHHLMPVAIRQYGLKKAIEQLIADINTSEKIFIEHIIVGFEHSEKYPEDFQINLYRIIQELLQNILKHSKAKNAMFQLVEHSDSLNLYIEDNGSGIGVEGNDNGGKGMLLLSTRVEYYEGKLTIEGQQGKGTLIIIDIPTAHLLMQGNDVYKI